MKTVFALLLLVSFFSQALSASAKPEVTVSIVPLKTFVEKISGDRITVNVMVLPGHSPALYEPKPSQMRALSASALYFYIGVPFERAWLKRFSDQNPKMTMVDTAKGIDLLEMAAHHHDEEEEEAGHDDHEEHARHEEEGKDPHIWLAPALVKSVSQTILQALTTQFPADAAYFKANYDTFAAEIEAADAKIAALLRPFKGESFMVFHPSWGYFAKAYGLVQLPIELEGKEPKPSQLGAFIREVKKSGARVIFVQPEFSQKAARTIAAESGIDVVTLSPLAPEWSQNLLDFAAAIAQAKR